MVAAVVDARAIDLGHVEEVFHDLRVLEGLGLDLGQGVQIDLVTILFLRGCDREEEQSRCR